MTVKGSPGGAKKCFEYGHRNNRGEPCGANVLSGTTGCRRHCGVRPAKAKAKGAVVVELRKWGLGDPLVDPGETLLRLVSQSAARVELLSTLLGEAYEAAAALESARSAVDGDVVDELTGDVDEGAAREVALDKLRKIFTMGRVTAFIGHTYTSTKDGDVFATGEAIRALARLEAEERDRCAGFAAKAVAAGLAERQVRLAERQGAEVVRMFQRVMDQLGLSADQRAMVPALLEMEVAALAGGRVIEGIAQ